MSETRTTSSELDGLARQLLVANAVTTVVSGLLQVVAPAIVLRLLRVDATPTARQLFGTIGMFMLLFGGQLAQSLLTRPTRIVLLWAGLQKLGASGAVLLGVRRGVFSPLALGVASYDLCNGCLSLWFWRHLRDAGTQA